MLAGDLYCLTKSTCVDSLDCLEVFGGERMPYHSSRIPGERRRNKIPHGVNMDELKDFCVVENTRGLCNSQRF